MKRNILSTLGLTAVFAVSIFTISSIADSGTTSAYANTGGSPGGKTNSPTDGASCTQCHSGTINSGPAFTNISSNVAVSGYVPGQRTHWAPFFVQKDKLTSKIYLCSRGYEFIKKGTKLDFNISFYGSEEKENFSIKYTIKSEENLELDISEILKGKKWKSNFGWAYIQFTEPTYFKAYFVSEYMKNSIMSNHAF